MGRPSQYLLTVLAHSESKVQRMKQACTRPQSLSLSSREQIRIPSFYVLRMQGSRKHAPQKSLLECLRWGQGSEFLKSLSRQFAFAGEYTLLATSKGRRATDTEVGLYHGEGYVATWSCMVYAGNMALGTSCRYSEKYGNEPMLGVRDEGRAL